MAASGLIVTAHARATTGHVSSATIGTNRIGLGDDGNDALNGGGCDDDLNGGSGDDTDDDQGGDSGSGDSQD